MAAPWTEETIKQCLYLYLALLPLNHKLIHELASVYTEAIADIKRTVLRVIEHPVSPARGRKGGRGGGGRGDNGGCTVDPRHGDELARAAAAGGELSQRSRDAGDAVSAHPDGQR